ncbi:MAG: XdhC family protein [Phycisphaerales bacterium]|nr:MAG: XdhC family protein [Phycisphaerales bacterium]
MDSPEVFEKTASVLETGANVALVTVIATIGSTPGKVGYKMLVWAGGQRTFGTVGGGLVEAEMIKRAECMLAEPRSETFQFNLGETPDDEKGICGGSVEFLVETFDESALPLFRDLADAAAGDEPAVLVSIISSGGLPRKIFVRDAAVAEAEHSSEITAAIEDVVAGRHDAVRISAGEINAFIEGLSSPPTVVLFGAGHLACHIARYASAVHFRVAVYDDRDEYAGRERFPAADDIVVADFGAVLDHIAINDRSYVVIVTRGHRCDETVLEQVVQTNARYVGMIGSRRKTRTILDKLRQKGFAEDVLGRVYSPIGLAIGAVTPEEIALSIVCELVKVRRLGRTCPAGHMTLTGPGGDA